MLPSSSESTAAWIRLTLIPGIGGETQRNLLKAFGLPEAVFSAGFSAVRGVIGSTLAERLQQSESQPQIVATVASTLAWAEQPGNHLLTLADADYPQALLSSDDPPILLYVKGQVALLNRPAIAIVGARSATHQGEENARSFARALSRAGLTVISGLALGCDAAAHRGALEAKGSTIAIIGTGADRIYPAANESLTREISQKGALISEFPLGTPAIAANFPRRNRLIAGMARGCLVVEAAERSGSLITARMAVEAGREVFAIPGSIHSPVARGCHKLIRNGAKLVETAADILEELRWEAVVAPLKMPSVMEVETDVVLIALGRDPCDPDTLGQRCGLSAALLLPRLMTLELEGRIAQLPGGRYQRLN